MLSYFETRTRIIALVAVGATIAALLLRVGDAGGVAIFAASAVALAGLAAMVGEGTEQLAHRLGPKSTGLLQSALGNLPEFFIGIFALRAGLLDVVRAALVGSILANTLLVLGLAFLVGGLRHGPQKFGTDQAKMMATLLLLAAAAIVIPTIATSPGEPDQGHAAELSVVVSVVLLFVFAASIPFSIGKGPGVGSIVQAAEGEATWPLALSGAVLLVSALSAAFVSDWFVEALKPAMSTLGMSETFAGLIVVAIAGNAVENVVGVQAMLANKADLAISVILNSSLQVALVLVPLLVLASLVIGGATLTLVVSPLLAAALAFTAILAALVVIDGESTWLEGVALIGLYVILAASVWWGQPIV
ncbi:MAG TPA: calcium/proton exchanger [Candidatus Limnocylindrales bacterium]